MTHVKLLAAGALAALLAACGGGDGAALPAPSAARAALAACDTQGLASGDYQLVGSDCVRSSSAVAPQRAAAALQAGATTVSASQLMDWAEGQYPGLFPAAGKTAGSIFIYAYRYYPVTGNYIGVSTETPAGVYLFGPISGMQLVRVGALADYTCTVLPTSCTAATLPGAPAITSATAGNASATIAVSAPTTGGGNITRYNATCSALGALSGTGTSTSTSISVTGLVNGTAYSCTATATNSAGTGSASNAVTVTPSATTTGGTSSASSTAGVQCSYSHNAFNSSASVQLTSTVSWSCSATQRSMTGNGVPDHATGTFPNANNPSRIAAVTQTAAMPLAPAAASSVTSNVHVVGYVLNGIKMDPATAATCSVSGSTTTCTADGNSGTWKIEALGQSVMNLGLDSNNAHVQPDGSYHYHGMPEGFITNLGRGQAMTLVGFALDGFPVYARYGYNTATSATSGIKVIRSSYQLKTTADSGRPSTASYPMGTFTQDYQYVAGSGDLDECNGRTGVTPEFPNGIYHYFITDTWPYMGRCLKGTPTTAR